MIKPASVLKFLKVNTIDTQCATDNYLTAFIVIPKFL